MHSRYFLVNPNVRLNFLVDDLRATQSAKFPVYGQQEWQAIYVVLLSASQASHVSGSVRAIGTCPGVCRQVGKCPKAIM